jgi:hypothetical protein
MEAQATLKRPSRTRIHDGTSQNTDVFIPDRWALLTVLTLLILLTLASQLSLLYYTWRSCSTYHTPLTKISRWRVVASWDFVINYFQWHHHHILQTVYQSYFVQGGRQTYGRTHLVFFSLVLHDVIVTIMKTLKGHPFWSFVLKS